MTDEDGVGVGAGVWVGLRVLGVGVGVGVGAAIEVAGGVKPEGAEVVDGEAQPASMKNRAVTTQIA